MGIHNLSKVLKTYAAKGIRELDKDEVKGKTLAMDTSNILYQFLIAIKNQTDDFKTKDGKVTTHIHAILMKTNSLLKKGIKPIYVFDGAPPSIKQGTLDARRDMKEKAMKKLEEKILLNEPDDEEHTRLKKRSVYITAEQMRECKEVLSLMGIPYVESPEEADSQCVCLVKKGFADGVGSEDMDILTFGAKKLYRNISNTSKVVEYDLQVILEELEMEKSEFVDMCILLGCDYSPTIEGVGMKRAHDLIKQHTSIEAIIELNKYKASAEFMERYPLARRYFKKAPVRKVSKDDITWHKPDKSKLIDILVNRFGYSEASSKKHADILEKRYMGMEGGDASIMKKCTIYDNEDMFSD